MLKGPSPICHGAKGSGHIVVTGPGMHGPFQPVWKQTDETPRDPSNTNHQRVCRGTTLGGDPAECQWPTLPNRVDPPGSVSRLTNSDLIDQSLVLGSVEFWIGRSIPVPRYRLAIDRI